MLYQVGTVAIAAMIVGYAGEASAQRAGSFGGRSGSVVAPYSRAGVGYHGGWQAPGRGHWDALAGPRWRSPIVVDTSLLGPALPVDTFGYGDPCLFRTHYGWIPAC